ncbi:hypothetical protein [Singulisphaera sp. PoT]|uniref:hypothetical protein n=1 Tax=Singulisphaera sp. PoT TaxID=3411797 RepID=UPI003BF5D8E4
MARRSDSLPREGNEIHVRCYLPPDVHEELQRVANANGLALASYCRVVLEDVAKRSKEGKKVLAYSHEKKAKTQRNGLD